MGHVPDTALYCDVDEYEEVNVWEEKIVWIQEKHKHSPGLLFVLCSQASEFEGIKIFHSNSSIYFANSDLYVNSLKEKVVLATVLFFVCVYK